MLCGNSHSMHSLHLGMSGLEPHNIETPKQDWHVTERQDGWHPLGAPLMGGSPVLVVAVTALTPGTTGEGGESWGRGGGKEEAQGCTACSCGRCGVTASAQRGSPCDDVGWE